MNPNYPDTYIIGKQVLLDTAKKHWKVNPEDKYFGLLPNSPYSDSKASADMIVRAYSETFGMP